MPDLGFLIPADKLVEPTLLVTADGDVLSANMAAAEEFGRHQHAWSLVALTADGGAQLRSYLALCAVSADPIPGALTLQDGRDFRVDGFVLRPASAERAAALCLRLRLRTESNASFVALNEKIAELSREIRERLRAEARLKETLEEKNALIRELHHRVRNALQVISSLASLEARQGEGHFRRRFIVHANRAKAIGLIYKHLYAQDLLHVPVRGFVREISDEIAGNPNGHAIIVQEDISDLNLHLSIAAPFALLVHELIAEALERADGIGRNAPVLVRLNRPDSSGLELTIAVDGGGGTPEQPPSPSSSGINLPAGLARQIGAEIHTSADGKTTVRMRSPQP